MPFLDKKKRKIVYTDFTDEVIAFRKKRFKNIPKMTGLKYQKEVKKYLENT